MFRLLCLFALLLPTLAGAAPITVKEIDFLLRQHTSEAEITSQVRARRLPVALDAAGEKQLREHGATAGLIALLKQPSTVLSASEAQSFTARTSPPQTAQPVPPAPVEGAPTARAVPVPQAPLPTVQNQRSMMEQLSGKLIHLEGDELKPLDVQRLKDVRVFAFYNSAMWCGPCRQFTPKLVEYYKQVKAKHPEFELVFLSSDRDEFNMATYMRSHKMPWPAVRYGAQAELAKLYCGQSIPWLVCVAANGQPLTSNAVDKKYIDPTEILGAIDYLLAQVKQ